MKRVPRKSALRLAAWAAGSAVISAAHAAGAPDPFTKLDLLPPDVDVAAVFDAPGTGWLREGSGLAATGLAGRAGLFTRTRDSWANLASALGFTPEEADRALLGGSVVLGWQGPARPGVLATITAAETGWIIVSEIDAPTASRVRERLRAVPRRVAFGTAVYSIDSGRIGMALVEDDDARRLFIAPVENADLLDECLGRVRRGLGEPGPGAATQSLLGSVDQGWSGVATIRFGEPGGEPVAIEMRAGGRDVGIRLAARGHAETGAPAGILNAIGGDALLAMASSGDPFASEAGTLRLGFDLQLTQPAKPSESQAGVRAPDGYALVIRGDADGSLTATITARAESDEAFARAMDRAVGRLIAPDATPAFDGRFPDAVRTHTAVRDEPEGGWPGPRAEIAWCVHADTGDRSGVVALSFGDARTGPAREARHARESWARVERPVDPDLVSAGYALPDRLVRAVGMERDAFGLVGRAIERVEWSVRQDGEIVRGEFKVRFNAPRARLGSDDPAGR